MKGEVSGKSGIRPEEDGVDKIGNMNASSFSMGSLDRAIKESIAADADNACSARRVSS